MKTIISLIFIVIILTAVGVSCSSGNGASPSPSEIGLGQQFALSPGQSQSLNAEDLIFKFIAVTADSRCPLGAQCIQAGQGVSQLQVTSKGQTSTLELVEIGLTSGSANAEMGLYKIAFQLTPYPEVGKQIKSSDYKLLLTVTR
jgi:hypothetical protein